jgi:hypothetical protein
VPCSALLHKIKPLMTCGRFPVELETRTRSYDDLQRSKCHKVETVRISSSRFHPILSDSHWQQCHFERGRAINSSGQIACLATDGNGDYVSVLLTPIPPMPGDTNCDKIVDVDDLLTVINAWGKCASPSECPADLTDNDVVDVDDLLVVLNNWTF